MKKPLLRYQLAVSLDGLIGPEDGSVDWLSPYDALGEDVMGPFMKEIGGLVMGRATYESCMSLGGWPFGDLPTAVLTSSTTLEVSGGFGLCHDGPKAALEWLAPQVASGDFWLVGGGRTAAWFLEQGLLDRIELTTVPVVLGEGKPLFPGLKVPTTFERLSTREGPQGAVVTVYGRK